MSNEERIVLKGDLLKYGSAFASLLLCTYYLGAKVERATAKLDANTEAISKLQTTVQQHTEQISKSNSDIKELFLYKKYSK